MAPSSMLHYLVLLVNNNSACCMFNHTLHTNAACLKKENTSVPLSHTAIQMCSSEWQIRTVNHFLVALWLSETSWPSYTSSSSTPIHHVAWFRPFINIQPEGSEVRNQAMDLMTEPLDHIGRTLVHSYILVFLAQNSFNTGIAITQTQTRWDH